ncbi:MAG: hypothetical protein LBN00_05805 [Oscillospiraceae bacterium]|jgi:curli biogenesis system outer membrane secretion channel CsgG|nr:hypothetical protein [Oscillospiraceae bacterium]
MKRFGIIAVFALIIAAAACSAEAAAPTEMPPAEPTEIAVVTAEATPGATSITLGTWSSDGRTFVNEWSNITFTLPEGWFDFTADMQAEMSEKIPDDVRELQK